MSEVDPKKLKLAVLAVYQVKEGELLGLMLAMGQRLGLFQALAQHGTILCSLGAEQQARRTFVELREIAHRHDIGLVAAWAEFLDALILSAEGRRDRACAGFTRATRFGLEYGLVVLFRDRGGSSALTHLAPTRFTSAHGYRIVLSKGRADFEWIHRDSSRVPHAPRYHRQSEL